HGLRDAARFALRAESLLCERAGAAVLARHARRRPDLVRDDVPRDARRPRHDAGEAVRRVGARGSGLKAVWLSLTLALLPQTIAAHIGSPDVFLDAQAGPYRALVTVRPPYAIPGVADVEVLVTTPGVWQVRVTIAGDQGEHTLAVPVPTLPQATLGMTRAVRGLLFILMLLLGAGFIAIIAAMAREARLDSGETPDPRARLHGRIAGAVAAGVVLAAVLFGNQWWTAEASDYARYVYKPLAATPTLTGGDLRLEL